MKKICYLFLTIVSMFLFISCGHETLETKENYIRCTGEIVEKQFIEIEAQKFSLSNIRVEDEEGSIYPVKVYFYPGDEKMLSISAQESMFDNILIDTSSSTLSVTGKGKGIFKTSPIRITTYGYSFEEVNLILASCYLDNDVYASSVRFTLDSASRVTFDTFEGVNFIASLKGSSEIIGRSIVATKAQISLNDTASAKIEQISAEDVSVKALNSSNVDMNVDVLNELNIELNQSSIASIKGKSNSMLLNAQNHSTFFGKNLITEIITVTASGESKCFVTATELTINASGNAKITYYGTPIITNNSITQDFELIDGTVIEETEETEA